MSVYRVAGLPVGISKPTARSIIDQCFASETQVAIRSLGLHPQTNSIVAIAMFFPIPARLLHGTTWKLKETVSYESAPGPQTFELEIDTHFLGFTPLNVVDSSSGDKIIDCIFVSGLSSHPFGSWKERGGQFMWLVDDENAYPSHVRVFLYGYDTSLFRSESFQDITDIGERLAVSIRGIWTHLSSVRAPEIRPIMFIAHSLGGLVVKEAICHMAREDPGTIQSICGLVFFGVPHDGLLVEPWLRIIEKQPNKQLIESMRPGSRYLQRLNDEFRRLFTLCSFRVVTIYETLVSKTTKEDEGGVITRSGEREVLVTPTSAMGHWPDSVSHTRIAMDRSHENLPKFRGRFDEDYLALKPYLQDVWTPVNSDNSTAATVFRPKKSQSDHSGTTLEKIESRETRTPDMPRTVCALTSLWPDPETADTVNIPTAMDIIAIHDLGENSVTSWTEGDKLWLRDFLPWKLPKARVLTFSYDGKKLRTETSSNVHHFATVLLDKLKDLRRETSCSTERKIIFLCHGFGGLIFKQAFVTAFENEKVYTDIAKSVTGAIFFGTPHSGLETSFWAELFAKFAVLNILPINVLRSLELFATELGTICTKFVERGLHLQIFSLYETQVMSGLNAVMVEKSSAILQLPNETTLPLNSDHMSMCRYLSSSSQNYVTVSECISEIFDNISGEPPQNYLSTSQTEFLSRLKGVDVRFSLNRIKNHGSMSSKWLFDHPEFQKWTQLQGRQIVWIHGPPGAGKTVLMRNVIKYLIEKSDNANVPIISKPIYFFFDDKDSTRKDSMAFVRSILDQIIRDRHTSYLLMYLDERDLLANKDLVEDELWIYLGTILERSRGIMFQFVIDAVDEALRGSESFSFTILDRLERLLSVDASGRIRLMISSRKKPTTEFLEADLAFVDVDNEMTRANVDSFVRTQVGRWIDRFQLTPSIGQTIESKIMDVSRGNFLHATLASKQFVESVRVWSSEHILSSLDRLTRVSHGLASVYCELLKTIPKQYSGQAKAAFAILRVTQDKLNSQQLAFFATLYHLKTNDDGNNELTVEAVKSQSDAFERSLEEICGYFIRRADDGIVDFAHVSAKDLFTESLAGFSPQERQTIEIYTMSEPEASLLMHKLCMEILYMENREAPIWQSTLFKLETIIKKRLLSSHNATHPLDEDAKAAVELGRAYLQSVAKTPCIIYAVKNWMHHYTAGQPDAEADKRLVAFLHTVPAYYYHMFWYSVGVENKQRHVTTYHRTHTASRASTLDGLFRIIVLGDCPRLIKAIIANNSKINKVSNEKDGITLLSWTIICQRKESFQVLLRNDDIQINYAPSSSPRPIQYAAIAQDTFYLAQLLRRGDININITSKIGTALYVAIKGLHMTAAHLLMDRPDVDIWAKHTDVDGTDTPYSLAFRRGGMEAILERMINIQSKNLAVKISGSSQFFMAGVHRWEKIEEIILDKEPHQVLEVDPTTGMNALESYAFFGRRRKLLWILDRIPHSLPIRVSRQKYDVLHLCADQNWPDVVDLLRERYGLKSLKSDHVGRTLLHWALEYNWELSATKLQEYSPGSLDIKDRDGTTALHIAVSNRNLDAVTLLVSSGANIHVKDKHGMTPVHLAADQGFRAALEKFISIPGQDFGTTRTGASLLHLLSLWFDGAFIRRFVKSQKPVIEVVDKSRRTPLHYAARVNNVSAVTRLLNWGSMINARDQNGMTPLHEAIRERNTETTILLLDWGADTRMRDAFNQSCLHLSLRYGHDELVARLLRNPSLQDIQAVDKFGMTPLHRACGTGRVDDVKALRRAGADWNVTNKYGRYPINMAVESRSTAMLKVMISWVQNSDGSQRAIDRCLKSALRLAYRLEATRMKDVLLGVGLQLDPSEIYVHRLYNIGPERESRWPIVPSGHVWYDDDSPDRMNPFSPRYSGREP